MIHRWRKDRPEMSPGEAANALPKVLKREVELVRKQADLRKDRGANALRNAAVRKVLRGPSPSAPGSPPGSKTGALRQSITPFTTGVSFGVSAGVEYAEYLERGTHKKDGSQKMAPRPFVEKIKEEALPEINRIFGEIGQ